MKNGMDAICGDKDLLISYLYDGCEPGDRKRMDAHLIVCAACRLEIQDLQATRGDLAEWAAPEQALGLKLVRAADASPPHVPLVARWRAVAGLAAAAVLVLAVASAVARVEVRYDSDGVTVRTGWGANPTAGTGAPTATAQPEGAEWRSELASLEQRLRTEMRQSAPQTVAAGASDSDQTELLRRVRTLVQESERRQDRELALRLAQAMRDINVQRQADLLQIQQGFGRLEGWTTAEAERQREWVNYVVRTSSPSQR